MQQRLGTALDRVLNSATVPRSTTAPSFNRGRWKIGRIDVACSWISFD